VKNDIDFVERPIKEENPNESELKNWIEKSEYPLKRFFNTSGMLYRDLNLKEKLGNMSDEEQIKLLSTDGMLVKRPILIGGEVVLVGFKEAEWSEKLL
jgi:arsenate reductase